MKQSSKRLTSILLSLLFVVAALLVLFDLVEPAYGDLMAMKGELATGQGFLSQEQSIITKTQNLISQYQSDSTAKNNLALAMPSGPDVSGALAQIYGLATANNLVVQNITVSAPSVQAAAARTGAPTLAEIVKPQGSITFQFSAVGSYENMKSFLAGLESNIRIFDIKTLSLQPGTSGVKGLTGTDVFTYSVAVTTYYQLQ